MKLQIKRATKEGKGLLDGAKFEYSINVQLLASDEEKSLWNKYNYVSERFPVSDAHGDTIPDVYGGNTVSFSDLLNGHTGAAKELFVVFTLIPNIIAQQLTTKHAELIAREHWNGQDEVLDLSEV